MAIKCQYFWKKQSGIAINFMKLGILFDNNNKNNSQPTKCPLIYLIIPGNPGCIHFYEKFAQVLHASTKTPVWGISHTGHTQASGDDDMPHPGPEDCGLEKQIQDKIQFLNEEVFPHVERIILIGHSIGCYLILQIMDRMVEKESCFLRSFLLFPTIERMRQTPEGLKITPLLGNARWLFMLLVSLARLLPHPVISWIVSLVVKSDEKCISQTILDHFYPNVTDCCTYMALHEMYEVNERDDHIIEKFVDKLTFYYGATDHWCPVSYYEDVLKHHGHRAGSNILLCKKGVGHAFVLNHSSDMANFVAEWMKEY